MLHTKLKRLALALRVNDEQLRSEHKRTLPLALARFRQDPLQPSASAWIPAVLDTPNTPNLQHVILRLTTFCGCTTSGVEHVHVVQDWPLTKRRGTLNTLSENDEIKLVHDYR